MVAHTIAKLQRSVSFIKLNGQLHGSSTVRPYGPNPALWLGAQAGVMMQKNFLDPYDN